MPKSVYMCGHNLTLTFPPDLHNYTELNGLVSFFSQFCITPQKKLILDWKLYCSAKRKKKTSSCKRWLLGGVLQKGFPKNFSKFREIPVLKSLSNTVKSLLAFSLAILLKRDPCIGVSEPTV